MGVMIYATELLTRAFMNAQKRVCQKLDLIIIFQPVS